MGNNDSISIKSDYNLPFNKELSYNKEKINITNLKSPLLNIIFSFINEGIKLKLIINNKKLQNKLNVNIQNYKNISKKYKIRDKNGKEAIYLKINKKFVFEGEYLNGVKNGIGKEYYYEDKLKFEGEYLNGKRHGKGKEYYDNGELIFEGEYLNGKRNGKGKEYYFDGELDFEDEYLNGNYYFKTLYEHDNEYKKGKVNINILKFEGEYLNGVRNGKGKEYNKNGELLFEGEYLNGKRNGKGKEYYFDGELDFEYGNCYLKTEYEHDIEYKKEKVNINILKFEGEYLNGKRNGKGKEYYDNGDLLFEGEYLNGKRNGKGKEYYYNGDLLFEGEYLNGKRNGKGKKNYYNGELNKYTMKVDNEDDCFIF